MSQNLRGTWGSVYAFGTDSTIALEGGATAVSGFSVEGMERRSRRGQGEKTKRRAGLRAPAWLALLVTAAMVFGMGMTYVVRLSEISATTKQVYRMREELARIVQTNEGLEVRIAEKADDTRIQALAINSLGMRQATAEDIYTVAPVSMVEPGAAAQPTAQNTFASNTEGDGFLELLLHMIGL